MRADPIGGLIATSSRGRTILAFVGDIDVQAVRTTKARDLIPDPATGPVIVDLASAKFLDSGAITLLLQLRRRADALGAPLTIVNVPATAQRAIRLAGVGAFLGLDDSAAAESTDN